LTIRQIFGDRALALAIAKLSIYKTSAWIYRYIALYGRVFMKWRNIVQLRNRIAPTSGLLRPFGTSAAPLQTLENVEVNDVTRDKYQGDRRNRVPLNHPLQQKFDNQWNALRKNNPAFGVIEDGGAYGQVYTNFLGKDWLATLEDRRKAAPNTVIRILWRSGNGAKLEACAVEDLEYLLDAIADSTAKPELSQTGELLRKKPFDSQGNMEEVASTLVICSKEIAKGHPMTVEIAIPFSDDHGRSFDGIDPYTDAYYLQKLEDALQTAKSVGFPLERLRISLKDMIGYLTEERAEVLLGKMMEHLEAQGLRLPIGVHCHDTGLAKRAYVGALRTARAHNNYPLNVDTILGTGGFVNLLELEQELRTEGYTFGFSAAELEELLQMQQIQLTLEDKFRAAKTPEIFSGAHLREYGIAGGAGGSTIAAIVKSQLEHKLKLSFEDTCHVVGRMLVRVWNDAGKGHPVTPAMQNYLESALHALLNMYNAGMLNHAIGNRAAIEQVILQARSAEEMQRMYAELPVVQAKFFRGQMPAPVSPVVLGIAYAQTIRATIPPALKGHGDITSLMESILAKPEDHAHAKHVLIQAGVNPVLAETLSDQVGSRRHVLTHGVPSLLPQAQKKAQKLLDEGYIRKEQVRTTTACLLINENFDLMVRDPLRYREFPAEDMPSAEYWEKAQANKKTLIAEGVRSEDAERMARAQIFFGGATQTWAAASQAGAGAGRSKL
jgi:hypothetical protein